MINYCVLMGKIVSDPRVVIIPQKDDRGNSFQKEYVYLDIELDNSFYSEVTRESNRTTTKLTVRFLRHDQLAPAKTMRKNHVLNVLAKASTYGFKDKNLIWQERTVFDVGLYRTFDDFRFMSKTATSFDETLRGVVTDFLEDAFKQKDWGLVETCLKALKNHGNGQF